MQYADGCLLATETGFCSVLQCIAPYGLKGPALDIHYALSVATRGGQGTTRAYKSTRK